MAVSLPPAIIRCALVLVVGANAGCARSTRVDASDASPPTVAVANDGAGGTIGSSGLTAGAPSAARGTIPRVTESTDAIDANAAVGLLDAPVVAQPTDAAPPLDWHDAHGAYDAHDAPDSGPDASDARRDAPDDAPLMGTVTFAEENPIRGIRFVTSAAALVHKAPKDHAAIATLLRGTEVALVAEYLDWYRVRYSDPVTQRRRQGWVYLVNFAGPRMKVCPAGWTRHEQDGGWCDRECKRNTDCKALPGYKCSGSTCFYVAP